MSKTRNRYSVAEVRCRKTGRIVCYLSERDMEQGVDIQMDAIGYEVIWL